MCESDTDLEDTIVFTIDPEILIPLEEDNWGDQNHIAIADDNSFLENENEIDKNDEINKKVNEINQMIEEKQIINKPLELNSPINWTYSETIKFLQIYRNHKCLWHKKDPAYKKRTYRSAAIHSIALMLNCKPQEVLKKIKMIQEIYQLEKKSVLRKGKKSFKWLPYLKNMMQSDVSRKLKVSNVLCFY